MQDKDKTRIIKYLAKNFETDQFRDYFWDMCKTLPDYIWEMPASTSGRYHNADQVMQRGQLVHVLMQASIWEHLLRLEYFNTKLFPTPEARDSVRCIPLFHDGFKCGDNKTKSTVPEHPMLAAKWVLETHPAHDIPDNYREFIADMCAAHSGQWNTDKKKREIMPKPKNIQEEMVHVADILSSRVDLTFIIPSELDDIFNGGADLFKLTYETYKLPFGKYAERTWPEIYAIDPGYCQWALENLNDLRIKKYLRDFLETLK